MLDVNRLRLQDKFKIPANSLVAKVASAIAFLVGSLVLIGWCFGIEVLKRGLLGSSATMKVNTALCFVLCGVSLWLFLKKAGNNSKSPISQLCAMAVTIIAALTLCQYLFGWNLGIDDLLLPDSPTSLATSHPGRMGVNTALNLMLVSVALQILIHPQNYRSYWYGQILALIASLISFQALIGYAYKVKVFYGLAPYTTSMALHTAMLFLLLNTGLLWAQAEQGLMRIVTSDTYGGLLARRLLVAAIAIPFILGWIIVEGQRAGQYDAAFAVSVFAIVLIVIFTVLIWQSAAVIERLSHERDCAQEALRTYETDQPIALGTVICNISEQKQTKEKILQLNKDLQRRITELQTLLEVIPIGIGIAEDPECQNIKVNPAFAKQLGISSDTNASLNAPLDEKPTSFKIYRKGRELSAEELPMQYSAAHGVEVLDLEVDIVHENGKILNLLEYVAPLFDEEGKTRGSVGAFLDITERKQAEEVLLNQQKWLEDVLNLMPRPLLFIEPGTARVTFANRSADELAGGEFPKGVPAEDYHTVYHYTDAAGDRIPNEQMPGVRVALGERLNGLEVDWHTPTGVRSLLIFADTLPAMHGHPATCILVFQEISNLKQAQKALSLGYKRLKLLFDTANDLLCSQQPVVLIDSFYRKLSEQIGLDTYLNYLVEDNSQVMRLGSYSGISPEIAKENEWLALGQGVCGLVAQERHPTAIENVQQSTDPETELIRSLGITAYYGYPLIAQGRLLGILSFGSRTLLSFTDNQKGMMQAVCDQIAIAMERASLIASLQQQTEQLQEANRMKDEFLGILSHELRSPLNAILGWAQLLQRNNLSATQMARATETIERNAKAQTQLIEDLLDVSRMMRGKLRLNVHTCNLVPMIESALETVSLAAQCIDLRFSVIPSEDSKLGESSQFLVSGDSERLQQIIWNLLSNAIKFTPAGGRVEVQLSVVTGQEKQQTTDKYAQIQVIDTGIGINRDFLPYVFDRFRQADSSSTRSYGGLGLGLAIVRHLVELHGGTIHVDSQGEDQGAIFTVKLPLVNSLTSPPLPFSSSPPLPPSLLGVRVLVVDDQADARGFITTVLEQYQAEVQAVASVQEALQVITQWKPDVLVSDIGMPQEDGYSLIRKLRSQPPELGGNIPAAALTAYARAEDRMRAIQEGYQLHLPKPIEPAELVTVVASLVGRI